MKQPAIKGATKVDNTETESNKPTPWNKSANETGENEDSKGDNSGEAKTDVDEKGISDE